MKILLTGSTGYIGRRLLPALVESGHHVVCIVREKKRFDFTDFTDEFLQHVTVLEADLDDRKSLAQIPADIDVAYYLVHSMSTSYTNFSTLETQSAQNFIQALNQTSARQIIYLSGIANDDALSAHLLSRKNVEDILKVSSIPVTILRAAIIIGSGSASFEIIRDLVEKLPIMIAPKWLKSKCQPLAIRNVIEYLLGVMLKEETLNQTFDIGGPDIVSYKEMLQVYAQVRGLKRVIITVPILSPKLSSLWLYFVTSTSYPLARSLASSLKNEVVCNDMRILNIVPVKLLSYEQSLQIAFDKIQNKNVVSSWKNALAYDASHKDFQNYIEVPQYGCLFDKRCIEFTRPTQEVIDNIWRIGGEHGWYFGNLLWRLRGAMDRIVGGVGLRRGRRNQYNLKDGDALDFWRVLSADKKKGRLLLFAEMKLPGEAWLEFKVEEIAGKKMLTQTATFRPLGLWGRLYWYAVLPFHGMLFPNMARNIVTF